MSPFAGRPRSSPSPSRRRSRSRSRNRSRSRSRSEKRKSTESPAAPAAPAAWNEGEVEEMSALWNLTPGEKEEMRELEILLADVNHWKNNPFEAVRYYRHYEQNVAQAALMFRRMVQWRIDHQMDTFLLRYGDPPKLFHYWPAFLCQGLDRDGDVVYVERVGASDPCGLLRAYGNPLDYALFIREITTTRSAFGQHGFCWQRDYYEPLMGRRIRQFTVLIDLHGFSLTRHFRPAFLPLLKRLARISQDMYAGMAKRIIFLRPPPIFEWGWKHLLQYFFDEHIRRIIVFSNPTDYLQVLDRYIDLTLLPDCLAPGFGTGQPMPGYFSNIHLEGGRIPKEHDYLPALVREPLGISNASLLEEEITLDGIHDLDISQVGVKGGSLMVGVAGGCLLKGIWEGDEQQQEQQSLDSTTQVTLVSRPSSFHR